MENSKKFREFTFGWTIFAVMIPTFGLLVFLYITGMGDRPLSLGGFIAISAVMAATCVLFYGLTTEVTEDTITVSFGAGLIRKSIPFSRITSVEPARSPWYYGWGVRLIPNGMMFNISGTQSVELRFKDSRRVFRIGTKSPLALKQEIAKRIG
jgi:hypothetical protein